MVVVTNNTRQSISVKVINQTKTVMSGNSTIASNGGSHSFDVQAEIGDTIQVVQGANWVRFSGVVDSDPFNVVIS